MPDDELKIVEADPTPPRTLVMFETPDDGDGRVDTFAVTDDSPEGLGFTIDSLGWTAGVILGRHEVDTLADAITAWRTAQDRKVVVPEGAFENLQPVESPVQRINVVDRTED